MLVGLTTSERFLVFDCIVWQLAVTVHFVCWAALRYVSIVRQGLKGDNSLITVRPFARYDAVTTIFHQLNSFNNLDKTDRRY